MSVVVPFRAVRPREKFVEVVASYPYDIVSLKEARKLAEANPRSFLRVIRSEVDLPPNVDAYDDVVYETARENLGNLLNGGILFQESRPCFYVYRQRAGEHKQYGIVAGVSVYEYESGHIKKHELTMAEKETDRIRHIAAVNAHTGPILITYRAEDSIDRMVKKIAGAQPEYDFTADDGISHTVWVIDDEENIRALKRTFLKIDSLYIADGHHRAASAAAVAGMRRAENTGHTGDEEYNYMMAVLFPHNQLRIMDYNRAVKDLNSLTEEEFISKVGEKFLIFDNFEDKSPGQLHEFGMYLGGRWYRLKAKDGSYDKDDIVGILDVSMLQNNLLKPVLGIDDPGSDSRIEFIGGAAGMEKLEELVDSGEFAVAFSLYPPALTQIMDIADAGKTMPPKSTWFEPKLRSGIFVHLLE
ncbi:MAG: DUF1015 domain-containing protein [Proteobacteria bacterium]|nr:DUF1015 domain-containing protein [Pseudomonadota bacterium]